MYKQNGHNHLAERVREAKAAAKFANVLQRDKAGKPREVLVPGHDGKQHSVLVKRYGGIWTVECRVESRLGPIPCQGNLQSVCYHSIAALQACAEEGGYSLRWARAEPHARNLENLGGKTFRVVSRQGNQAGLWVVVEKKKTAQQDTEDLFGKE